MMKKGQAEIFGLVIIVLLLIFAMLFFVRTSQNDDSSVTLRSNFRANNMLNAIMNYEVDDFDMLDELRLCVDEPSLCGDTLDQVDVILDNSLTSNENYEFLGFKDNIESFRVERGNCVEGITARPRQLPGNYKFTLKLCF
jgi:hypothetical protein